MSLSNFFKVNLPYGIKRNNKDEWMAFNREYMPIGWNKEVSINTENYPIFTKYKGLTEKKLIALAWGERGIERDDDGKIICIFFYKDGTNPAAQAKYWDEYLDKIKVLSALTRPNDYIAIG